MQCRGSTLMATPSTMWRCRPFLATASSTAFARALVKMFELDCNPLRLLTPLRRSRLAAVPRRNRSSESEALIEDMFEKIDGVEEVGKCFVSKSGWWGGGGEVWSVGFSRETSLKRASLRCGPRKHWDYRTFLPFPFHSRNSFVFTKLSSFEYK